MMTAYTPPPPRDWGLLPIFIIGICAGIAGLLVGVPITWIIWAMYHA